MAWCSRVAARRPDINERNAARPEASGKPQMQLPGILNVRKLRDASEVSHYGLRDRTHSSMALMLQPYFVWPSPKPSSAMICSQEHPAVS